MASDSHGPGRNRSNVPPLSTLVRREYIDNVARTRERISLSEENPYLSYYRILDFIGRSPGLLQHGRDHPLDFTWMGAVDGHDINVWLDTLFSTFDADPRFNTVPISEEEPPGGSSSISVWDTLRRVPGTMTAEQTQTFIRRAEREYYIQLHPLEFGEERRDGFMYTTERWGYSLLNLPIHALAIPRSSGTLGKLPCRQYQQARAYEIRFDCEISIVKIESVRFEYKYKEYIFGTQAGERKLIDHMVELNGFLMIPSPSGNEWHEGESIRYTFSPDRFLESDMRNLGLNSIDLSKYMKPTMHASDIRDITIGYSESEKPIMGGWVEEKCGVPFDLHLFDFRLKDPPLAFEWVMELAAGFARWKNDMTFRPDKIPEEERKRRYKQYYGLRGPIPHPDPLQVFYIYRRDENILDFITQWMKENSIELSDRQEYALEDKVDYSVERRDLCQSTFTQEEEERDSLLSNVCPIL